MNDTIMARPRLDGQQIVNEFAAPVVELDKLYANAGIGKSPATGDVYRLTVRSDNLMPARVYADGPGTLKHLDNKPVGYQWGDDEDGNPLGLQFTYLGEYMYVAASLDQATLNITMRFQRIEQDAA